MNNIIWLIVVFALAIAIFLGILKDVNYFKENKHE